MKNQTPAVVVPKALVSHRLRDKGGVGLEERALGCQQNACKAREGTVARERHSPGAVGAGTEEAR